MVREVYLDRLSLEREWMDEAMRILDKLVREPTRQCGKV